MSAQLAAGETTLPDQPLQRLEGSDLSIFVHPGEELRDGLVDGERLAHDAPDLGELALYLRIPGVGAHEFGQVLARVGVECFGHEGNGRSRAFDVGDNSLDHRFRGRSRADGPPVSAGQAPSIVLIGPSFGQGGKRSPRRGRCAGLPLCLAPGRPPMRLYDRGSARQAASPGRGTRYRVATMT